MSTQELERRLAAVEKAVAELQQKLNAVGNGTAASKLPPPDPTPMTPEDEEAFRHMTEFGRYYRQTGKDPPPDWKPGDPIPEPDPEWLS